MVTCYGTNGPFAGSGHIGRNKLYTGAQITQWDFQNQRKVGLDWKEFHRFRSRTALFASEHNLIIPYHVTVSCKGPIAHSIDDSFPCLL